MCRSCGDGGRRCPGRSAQRAHAAHNGRRRAWRSLQRLEAGGITAGRGPELGPVYWSDGGSGARLARSKLRPVQDPDSVLWKPTGGLWTAPPLPDAEPPAVAPVTGFHTTWTDWRAREYEDGGTGALTAVHPSASSVVVHVTTAADLEAIRQRWPLRVETAVETIDGFSFEAMCRDGVDALRVDPAASSPPIGDLLYGWDVDTVFWLNPAKVTLGRRVSVS